MIRRRVGDEYRLIPQHEHALLSGKLAAALRDPLPADAVTGIGHHDAGWPLHDDRPTLSRAGLPLDVFETPMPLGLEIWLASAERAAAEAPHAGLLVSLHSLSLAGHALSPDLPRRTQFDWLAFTTRIAELQMQWRQSLGMQIDRPTSHGLAHGWSDDRETALRAHFRWLQALDKLSLDACRTELAFGTIEVGPELVLRVERSGEGQVTDVRVGPWVFAADVLEFDVPYRAVPAKTFGSADELHRLLGAASWESMHVSFRPLR